MRKDDLSLLPLEKEQKVYDISGTRVGGQPGVNPTVLIGSVFYEGHRVVRNKETGECDCKKLEDLINCAEGLSEKYGNPLMLDIVGSSEKAFKKYIDLVSELTDVPILLDGVNAKARIAAINYVSEIGLHERTVLNSINRNTKDEEVEAYRRERVRTAIIFTYSLHNPTIEGRLDLLRGNLGDSLISKANQCGMERLLVDTCVLDPPDLGPATKTIVLAKSQFGYPTGCGSGNAVDLWNRIRELDKKTYAICVGSALAFPASHGADFLLFGPIEQAKYVFPVSAMYDSYVAYTMRQYGMKIGPPHPLYKIF